MDERAQRGDKARCTQDRQSAHPQRSKRAEDAEASHGEHAPRSSHSDGQSKRGIVVAVVALLIGVAVFAYPMVSNWLSQHDHQEAVSSYTTTVAETDQAELDAERERAVDYNNRLLSSRTVITDPFDPNAQRTTAEEYDSLLNLAGDGIMGTITIPAIHVSLPIYHGTSDEVLQEGVGHLSETSLPVGGESTHAVLSGHTGLPSGKIFDNLDQLEEGDYFIITVLGEDLAYRVTSIETVLPDETDSLVIQPGKDLVTLVTCTPYGVNTHRLLVHAERCEVPEEWLNKGDETFPAGYSDPPDKALVPSIILGLLLAALIIGGNIAITKVREKKRRESTAEPSPRGGAPHRSRGSAAGVVPVTSRAHSSSPPHRPRVRHAQSTSGNQAKHGKPAQHGMPGQRPQASQGAGNPQASRSTQAHQSPHHPKRSQGPTPRKRDGGGRHFRE